MQRKRQVQHQDEFRKDTRTLQGARASDRQRQLLEKRKVLQHIADSLHEMHQTLLYHVVTAAETYGRIK